MMVMRMTVPAAAASTDPTRPGKVHAHVGKATMGRLPHDRNPINHVVLVVDDCKELIYPLRSLQYRAGSSANPNTEHTRERYMEARAHREREANFIFKLDLRERETAGRRKKTRPFSCPFNDRLRQSYFFTRFYFLSLWDVLPNRVVRAL